LWNTEQKGKNRLVEWEFAIMYTAGGTDGTFVDIRGNKLQYPKEKRKKAGNKAHCRKSIVSPLCSQGLTRRS